MDIKEAFVQTFSGKKVHPFAPDPNEVDIRDIAWALSMQPRFNGHCKKFFSVAQHAVNCSLIAEKGFEWEALHHDDEEYIFGDIPTPIKMFCTKYRHYSNKFYAEAISPLFGIPMRESNEVRLADKQALLLEKNALITNQDKVYWSGLEGIQMPDLVLVPLAQPLAHDLFMNRFHELYKQRMNNA